MREPWVCPPCRRDEHEGGYGHDVATRDEPICKCVCLAQPASSTHRADPPRVPAVEIELHWTDAIVGPVSPPCQEFSVAGRRSSPGAEI